MLPAFLTLRVFALELIRQKLIVENENFLNFKKYSEIKFPWVVGPFIIKNKSALPMIESLLREMGFQTEVAVNYDPHRIISIKRQVNKNKRFEHFELASLSETTNWLDYPHETQGDFNMQEDSTSSVSEFTSPQHGTSIMVPTPKKLTPIASCFDKTN